MDTPNNVPSQFDDPAFTHFLRSGVLAELRRGMSYEELLGYLGKPLIYQESDLDIDGTFTVYYDHLLVFFYKHELHLFQIQFKDLRRGPLRKQRYSLPMQFGADWYATVKQMMIGDFIAYAKSHDVRCARLMTDERSVLWLEEGQLEISFEGIELRVYHITAGRHGPGNRQFEPC